MENKDKLTSKFRPSRLAQLLPQHGYLYFDYLNAEFQSSPGQNITQQLREVIDDLLKKRKDHSLTWNHLYTFDLILSRLLPPERLAREVWSLRSRYRDIAGLRVYEAYLASKPPDLAGQLEEQDLRADIEYLLGEIYLRYGITPFDEKVRSRISRRVMGVILAGVAIVLLVIILNVLGVAANFSATLIPVLFVGAMGGLLSMQQRYQSVPREGDPIDNVSQLTQDWSRLFLPAVNGAIFAALLYMLIIGKLIEGELFPKLTVHKMDPNDQSGIVLQDLINYAKPDTAADYAKLIVWSFLAGFAERFVPDTLSRFVSKKDADSKAT